MSTQLSLSIQVPQGCPRIDDMLNSADRRDVRGRPNGRCDGGQAVHMPAVGSQARGGNMRGTRAGARHHR